ncbi:Ferrous-iron efflux pump FieF [bioreactor metagenome]|uniref:Ferrous-iron efflux pump FieF n=1 Tax=bioreactor metagenome TaxID=1076179 RepID=A0A645AFK3_9ZZZZ
MAITADAFNNLSDAGSSVITLVGFRLAGQRADKNHPFGHGRLEYLSGLLVSLLILLVGVELGKASVQKIFNPEPVVLTALTVGVLAASIGIKLWMSVFNRSLSRRVKSAAMAAVATDSLSDAVATSAVLLSLVIGHFTGFHADAWAGLLVAAFILRAGWGAVRDTLDPLLGKTPDPELVRAIEETVMRHSDISGLHDLVIHDYGPGRSIMSLHAEVPAGGDLMALHETIDALERELKERFGIETTIHMDPIVTDDGVTTALREAVEHLVREVNPQLSIHDFRMTAGRTHTNLIFDVVVPFNCPLNDRELEQSVRTRVRALEDGKYDAVIQLDRSYV